MVPGISEPRDEVRERPLHYLPLHNNLKSQVQSSGKSFLREGKEQCVFRACNKGSDAGRWVGWRWRVRGPHSHRPSSAGERAAAGRSAARLSASTRCCTGKTAQARTCRPETPAGGPCPPTSALISFWRCFHHVLRHGSQTSNCSLTLSL